MTRLSLWVTEAQRAATEQNQEHSLPSLLPSEALPSVPMTQQGGASPPPLFPPIPQTQQRAGDSWTHPLPSYFGQMFLVW